MVIHTEKQNNMISEIDLRDFERSEQPVKLYDVPRGSTITLATMDSSDLLIDFHHIDGAYSMCTIHGTNEICHISASAEVYLWAKK